ncbi:plasminogen-binding N-terminal domain-containing protein [Helicobacter sp. T3_23-1059]
MQKQQKQQNHYHKMALSQNLIYFKRLCFGFFLFSLCASNATQSNHNPTSIPKSTSISKSTSQKLQHLDTLQKTTKATISAIDEKNNIIEFVANGRRVGESGFVWHTYDENYAGIIASATIIEIESSDIESSEAKSNGGKSSPNDNNNSKEVIARAKISPATLLEQRYLPSPTNKPEVGDEVHFGTLNTQAFIIAPTLETYDEIRASYPSMQFLNSDLMVGYLFDRSKFDPKPKVISKSCAVYSVGLLFLVTRDRLSVLDCESLVVLDSTDFDTSGVGQSVAPFFSRVQYAASGSLDSTLRRKHSKQYFEYYEGLLKEGKNFK